MGFIIIICVVAGLGYYLSLKSHPWTKCKQCDGKGRFYHKSFTGAFGLCSKCGGNGREKRWGARFVERK
jgi:DnaJ-class molecular chaperone